MTGPRVIGENEWVGRMVNNQHRKNSFVMKLTARPRIGQENRQRPTLRNGLMDIDLNLATWNVRTLLRPGGLRTLADVLRKGKFDITAVQETRWPDANLLKSREYSFYYSGKANRSGSLAQVSL